MSKNQNQMKLCEKHKLKFIEFFCEECKEKLCSDCLLTHNETHHKINFKLESLNLMKKINKNAAAIIPLLLKRENLFVELVSQFKNLLKKAEKNFAEMMKPLAINGMSKIKKCKGKILEELKRNIDNAEYIEAYDIGKIIINQRKDNIDSIKGSLIEKISEMQRDMNTEIIHMKSQILAELLNKKEIIKSKIAPYPISSKLPFEPECNIQVVVTNQIIQNGIRFSGILENGKRIKGEMIWPNGAKYSGRWKNDLFDGDGDYTSFLHKGLHSFIHHSK